MGKIKVSVVGAGNVGALAAKNIVTKSLADVALVDVAEGIAKGKAIDLSQDAVLHKSDCVVEGGSDFSIMKNSRIVAVCAGQPRTPGMTREDLIKKNSLIVKSISEQIKKYAPESIIITVTNPLDIMSWYMLRLLDIQKNKLIAMGGALDTARYHYYLSRKFSVPASKITGMVIGAHSDTMVPLVSKTVVDGRPLSEITDTKSIQELIAQTKNGGAEIVGYLKTGSAYFAPGASVALMVEAILKDSKLILPCGTLFEGEYGIENVFLGVGVILGKNGIEKVVEESISPDERKALEVSAEQVRKNFSEVDK